MSGKADLLPTLPHLLVRHGHPIIHRDVSWLQFNDRVLSGARSPTNPLFARLRFLSITSSNLDEFFMIRVSSLIRSLAAARLNESKGSLLRIHDAVLTVVKNFGKSQTKVLEMLRTEAETVGIYLHRRASPQSREFQMGRAIFIEQIMPALNLRDSFSFSAIAELQNLQMLVHLSKNIWFEVPRSLPHMFTQKNASGTHVFFLDDLMISHLDHMIPVVDKPGVIKITRDADFSVEFPDNDPAAIPDIMRDSIKTRDKGRLVRIQWSGFLRNDFLEEMAHALKLDKRYIFAAPSTLCLGGIFNSLALLSEPPSRSSATSSPLRISTVPYPFEKTNGKKLFQALNSLDFILHHPYDSFDAFLVWLGEAVEDAEVVSIQQTIYRTDSGFAVVDLLKKAAHAGKKVRVILELRARFDESNNLQVAEELAKAGVEVKFGFGALKLHAKITLLTKIKEGKTIRYTHLSTGNYNLRTAKIYTDISILTANAEIGIDAQHFFDAVFKQEIPSEFTHLVVAPRELHAKLRSLIKQETDRTKKGEPGHIVAKVNALVDEKLIEDLYTASSSGVKIDLIVRGACSLIPGIKGLSENIRVVSIIDQYLEHSRIYYFKQSKAMYLSSADWMPRNFFSRLEIAFPILDARIYRFMEECVIPAYLRDTIQARRLTSKGTWIPINSTVPGFRAQQYLEQLATHHYHHTPLEDHDFFRSAAGLDKQVGKTN